MKLRVYELVGENCMTQQAGQTVYDQVLPVLQAGEPVELDFAGVKRFLTVFFNHAIGQLYQNMPVDEVDVLLTNSNLNSVGTKACDRVVENAKRLVADPDYRRAVDELFQEQSLSV